MGTVVENIAKVVRQICSQCGKERHTSTDRVPRGWKRTDSLYCDICWQSRMVLRALTIPVVEVLTGTWKEFDAAMHLMYATTTQCANWMMTQFYVRDVRREGQAKLPAMPQMYLYPEARALFPQLPPQAISALEQVTKAKYRAQRYDIVWRSAASLPNYRYPVPFSLPNQAWSVVLEEGRVVVDARIGEHRWQLKLQGGMRYQRQVSGIRQLLGGGIQGSLDFYQKRIDGKMRTLCKMVVWVPRPVQSGLEGTLGVLTAPGSLLLALDAKGDKLWTYHADQLARWAMEHREQLQRWSDDQKFEARPVPPFAQRRSASTRKYRQRMHSAALQAAAYVAGYALRRKYATVLYDDRERLWFPDFPWAMLRSRLATKLKESGIQFLYKGEDHGSNSPEVN